MASRSGVTVLDLGWARMIKGFERINKRKIDVGIRNRRVAKYAAILQARYGWKSLSDDKIRRLLDRYLVEVLTAVVDGKDIDKTLLSVGERMARFYRVEISKQDLIDTGLFLKSIMVKL